jgi:hypothetical protein
MLTPEEIEVFRARIRDAQREHTCYGGLTPDDQYRLIAAADLLLAEVDDLWDDRVRTEKLAEEFWTEDRA